MSHTLVFRVSFSGSDLDDSALAALASVAARWESTQSNVRDPRVPSHHYVLVCASEGDEAMRVVRGTLTGHGEFANFAVAVVRDANREARSPPIRMSWDEIAWQEVARTATLSSVERLLLGSLLDAAEPTWIILRSEGLPDDRARLEALLERLEERELVHSRVEPSGEPESVPTADRWWALTDRAWDLLGLIKPPGYG